MLANTKVSHAIIPENIIFIYEFYISVAQMAYELDNSRLTRLGVASHTLCL